jgi:pentapeptide MXKDX repeat protein
MACVLLLATIGGSEFRQLSTLLHWRLERRSPNFGVEVCREWPAVAKKWRDDLSVGGRAIIPKKYVQLLLAYENHVSEGAPQRDLHRVPIRAPKVAQPPSTKVSIPRGLPYPQLRSPELELGSESTLCGWVRVGWDGMGWDGMGWDGMGWDGMGWDGMGWDEWEWDGMGWDGMGWDGMGWDGMGWDGMGVLCRLQAAEFVPRCRAGKSADVTIRPSNIVFFPRRGQAAARPAGSVKAPQIWQLRMRPWIGKLTEKLPSITQVSRSGLLRSTLQVCLNVMACL